MNVAFFGTGSFGVRSLDALRQSSHKLLAVVTAPEESKVTAKPSVPPLPVIL